MAISPDARDQELFVVCKSCGFPIASGIRGRPSEPALAEGGTRDHRCPRCGHVHAYGPVDYAHRETASG